MNRFAESRLACGIQHGWEQKRDRFVFGVKSFPQCSQGFGLRRRG